MSYSAGWTQILDSAASAGHYRRSSQVGATATFSFELGSGVVRWGAVRGPSGGRADVAVDGVFEGTVDLYAPTRDYWYVSTFIPLAGRHSLRVTVRGDADPAATGTDVLVDYFEVVETVGGRGFGLRSHPIITSWTGGGAQTGYQLLRTAPSGTALLPPSGPLGANATTYTDVSQLPDLWYCYVLLALRGTDAIANSDVLCLLPNLRAGAEPEAFTLRLHQSSSAALSWALPSSPLPELTGYLLIVLGDSPRTLLFGPGTGSVQVDTGGRPTCFILVAMAGADVLGNTNGLCAAPGFAFL